MAPKSTPKGGGKGARGENLYTPVSQKTIDRIKTMGMTKALAKAGKTPKGANAEFIQGVKRMYGANRLAAARKSAAPAAPSKRSPRVSERMISKTSARAVERGAASAQAKKTSSGMGTWKKGNVSIQVPTSKPKPKKVSQKPTMGTWKKGNVSIKVKSYK